MKLFLFAAMITALSGVILTTHAHAKPKYWVCKVSERHYNSNWEGHPKGLTKAKALAMFKNAKPC